jgi:hypothetical protein
LQALHETQTERGDMTRVGPYLKWLSQDIAQEGAAQLAAYELEWRDVVKGIQTGAKTWFMVPTTAPADLEAR